MTQRDALAAAVLILNGDTRTYTNLDRAIYADGKERLNFYIFGVEPDTEREGILASSEQSWEHALAQLKAKHGTWPAVPDPSADDEPAQPEQQPPAAGGHWWGGNPHSAEGPGHFPEDEAA